MPDSEGKSSDLGGSGAFSEVHPAQDTDLGVKVALGTTEPQELPLELQAELTKMRRNPASFHFKRRVKCSLSDKTGAKSAYQIGHADSPEAGTWCPEHGWLSFDSPQLPPTEPRRSK